MRGRRRNRVLLVALTVSALFHLSAVTVFRIVILFPKQEVEYVDFQIVQAAPQARAAAVRTGERLRAPALGTDFDYAALADDRLVPDIDLPTLEFAELQRLSVRREGMLSDELRREIFREQDPDSWQRFGEQLGRLRRTLTGLAPGDEAPQLEPGPGATPSPPSLRPAEGFDAFVDWDTPPRDRDLLFAPPLEALWEADPADLRLPVTFVFEVTPMGRVVNVWSPAVDPGGIVDRLQLGVLRYRFEPLSEAGAGNQLGTLRIEKARARR